MVILHELNTCIKNSTLLTLSNRFTHHNFPRSTFQIYLWNLPKAKLFKVVKIFWASELGVRQRQERLTWSRIKTVTVKEVPLLIKKTRMEYESRPQVDATKRKCRWELLRFLGLNLAPSEFSVWTFFCVK